MTSNQMTASPNGERADAGEVQHQQHETDPDQPHWDRSSSAKKTTTTEL
jgi:hypothetical protein